MKGLIKITVSSVTTGSSSSSSLFFNIKSDTFNWILFGLSNI